MRIPFFEKRSEREKVQIDRRAFLRGMAVTAAGLVVPKTAIFDEGRIVRPLQGAVSPPWPTPMVNEPWRDWADFARSIDLIKGAIVYAAAKEMTP